VRLSCRAVNDDIEGYTTIAGNAGTNFLQPLTLIYTCVAETLLTDGASVNDAKTIRKTVKGELVEALSVEKNDKSISARRMQVRSRKDKQVGWVTIAGNKGAKFFEPIS